MKRTLAALIVPLFVLAGCSGGSDGPAGDVAADPAFPKCEDVWVVGKQLPVGYGGCEADDTIEAFAVFDCNDGVNRLGSFRDRYWVLTPGVIADAGDRGTAVDAAYAAAYRKCNG